MQPFHRTVALVISAKDEILTIVTIVSVSKDRFVIGILKNNCDQCVLMITLC